MEIDTASDDRLIAFDGSTFTVQAGIALSPSSGKITKPAKIKATGFSRTRCRRTGTWARCHPRCDTGSAVFAAATAGTLAARLIIVPNNGRLANS